ncbi:MAG TPA: phospho-sugar mutase [Opitutaceae bacterium]|jgi:phosphoglucomutase|nr:phospho-sugar mutase [Opitutaceae bacterium]
MPNTVDRITAAAKAGHVLPSTAENAALFIAAGLPEWALASIDELVAGEAWSELNDRFYQFLEFGTGGIRGRTIGNIVTRAERGAAHGVPERAAVGSNLLNDFTLIRATVGLFRYTQRHLEARGQSVKPRLAIAYDVRHFSKHFCALAASTWSKLGGEAFIFDEPRPTPQLSFTVRWLQAHAGVVITASHNPPHDNGFKAYFDDGAQVVPPDDTGIVQEVNAVPLSELSGFLETDLKAVTVLGRAADDAYLTVAARAALDPAVFRAAKVKVVFTNIHGTGGVHVPPLLLHAGCELLQVKDQVAFDGAFPTVKSPNPENAEALSRAVAVAEANDADLVLATDPDCDRMGCAVRNAAGKMELLTGNQVGALLADYRLAKYKEMGWIPAAGAKNACVIKTFVTSRLQDAVGEGHGVKVINTLTGFKWIAAKLRRYEEKLQAAMGPDYDYDAAPMVERARLHLAHSTFFAFGTEESYGYLPNDMVRDKDGNAACLMMAELCAWAKARGRTVTECLDELYVRHGFYFEGVINLYYEGASGNAKIRRILETYRSDPPRRFGEVAVDQFQDFGREEIFDADGEAIPKQDLYLVTLANGYSYAARGSGTEPKMKFYLFARAGVASARELPEVKRKAKLELDRLKAQIEADARARAEG